MIAAVTVIVLFSLGAAIIHLGTPSRNQQAVLARLSDIAAQYDIAAVNAPRPYAPLRLANYFLARAIQQELRLIGIRVRSVHIVIGAVLSVVVIGTTFWLAGLTAAAACLVGAAYLVRQLIGYLAARRRKEFSASYPAFIDRIQRLAAIGNSLGLAIEKALEFANPRLVAYVRPALIRQKMGMPLAVAFHNQATRLGLPELAFLAFVAQVNTRFGGNLSEAMTHIAQIERNRLRSFHEFEALTAEVVASARMLTALPVVVAAAIFVVNPDYIRFFLDDPSGSIILYICAGFMVGGFWAMRHMSRIDP